MTYDLRRLRLHGLIERIPGTHRYQVTAQGLRVAVFFTRTHARLLRPKLADIFDPAPQSHTRLRKAFDRVDQEIKRCCQQLNLAA
jgi:predicted MarR family transcription regulator